MDLRVVYAGPPREDAYQAVRHCLNVRGLEPHVDSEQEAQAVRTTLERMTATSIPLFPVGE